MTTAQACEQASRALEGSHEMILASVLQAGLRAACQQARPGRGHALPACEAMATGCLAGWSDRECQALLAVLEPDALRVSLEHQDPEALIDLRRIVIQALALEAVDILEAKGLFT